MDTRELDARVAREVMGREVETRTHDGTEYLIEFVKIERDGYRFLDRLLPDYSTDMNAAMEVVAAFDALGWIWTLQSELKGRWRVMLTRGPNEWIRVGSDDGLPLAICLAAMDAVAGKDKP